MSKSTKKENPEEIKEVEKVDETSEVNEELEKLQKELADTKDLLLRTAAEFDNYKKRTQKESESIGATARATFTKNLLPIVDNLERAEQNADASIEDYKKGIEMTTKQFFDILKNAGLEEIDAKGKPFDPNFHYAVAQVEVEGAEPDTVAEVFQKGYKMGDTVIRPSMVSVVKAD